MLNTELYERQGFNCTIDTIRNGYRHINLGIQARTPKVHEGVVNFENLKVRLFLSLSATAGNALDCRYIHMYVSGMSEWSTFTL